MKKLLYTSLVLVLVLSLAACGTSGSTSKGGDASSAKNTTSESKNNSGNVSSQGSAVSEPVAEGAGALGDYYVEIKNAALSKDYEGNPAIIITYSWTNNSDKTTSAMVALIGKAFQDGIGLETAIIIDDDNYESGSSMTEIRPGASIDVQGAFKLAGETSIVEFELSELISFSDDVVAMDFDPATL